ncbi:UNVERIFIED_CONTAM: hypothetical protein K2H54_000162 [Gekko kuhli]
MPTEDEAVVGLYGKYQGQFPPARQTGGSAGPANPHTFAGYRICAFPDALDEQTPAIGYMPGRLTWKFGERLKGMGFEIVNSGISGEVCRDRNLLTGDSPLAGNRSASWPPLPCWRQ